MTCSENENNITVSSENEGNYRVLLQHSSFDDSKSDAIDFTLLFLHEDEGESTLLHSCEIEGTSTVVARELARRFKEHLMDPDVRLMLWSRALAELMGFEIEPSKGTGYFFEQVASHIATEDLEEYAQGIDFEPLKIKLKNELKTRGEIKNDRNN